MKIGYINTDFDLRSEHDLSPIVKAFGEAVHIMYHKKEGDLNLLSFEIACTDGGCPITAEEAVSRYCDLVEGFSPQTRESWNCCHSRVVDVGFMSGEEHPTGRYRSQLTAKTIQRLAALETGVTITIYPIGAYGDD